MTADRIQPGIYFRPGERPPACYRLVLLTVPRGVNAPAVHTALGSLLAMLGRLREEPIRDLSDLPLEDHEAASSTFAGLDILVAFGRRLFDSTHHDPPLTDADRPPFLAYLPRESDAFPAIPWGIAAGEPNLGEADLALQLTGTGEAAVNQAAVEVWKLTTDEALPLDVIATFSGFQRPDGRGWLEFHDGVSNIASPDRLQALAAGDDPAWMAGGTYMAYLRFAVDLRAWRSLSREHQELLIGRDKLRGAPLSGVVRDGAAVRPWAEAKSGPTAQADFADPPQTTDPLLEASHIHRANQNRSSTFAPGALRIFRQGYDYLEYIGLEGPSLGLNFVSFQSDLAVLQHLLYRPGWLGDVNFGGPSEPGEGEPRPIEFIRLLAGGFYAVPPAGSPFPGSEILRKN